MSDAIIRRLLEVQLNTVTPRLEGPFENVAYKPTQRVPWQRVTMLVAKTQGPTFGDDFKREGGIMQVSLFYPVNEGAENAVTRSMAIKQAFRRGSSFEIANVRVRILEHPYNGPAMPEDGWFHLPVSIPYVADVS